MYQLKYNKNIDEFRIRFNELIGGAIQGFCLECCRCFAIHDYYPISGIGNDVDNEIAVVRRFVFNFKDGKKVDVEYAARIVVAAIKKENINLNNTCLMIIPASTPQKTERRFKFFCQMLSMALNINNGYDYLTTVAHEETKGDKDKNILPYLTFNNERYKDKNVLLFDDVTTSGSSFRQVAEKLLYTGAKSVTGIFLAKTTRE